MMRRMLNKTHYFSQQTSAKNLPPKPPSPITAEARTEFTFRVQEPRPDTEAQPRLPLKLNVRNTSITSSPNPKSMGRIRKGASLLKPSFGLDMTMPAKIA